MTDENKKDMPSIKVEFVLSNNGECEMDLDLITSKLDIIPTRTRLVRDYAPDDRRRTYMVDMWSVSATREISYSLNEYLNPFIIILNNKRDIIRELQETFFFEAYFMVYIHTDKEEGYPKMVFSREFIELAAYLNARVGIDHYRY